MAEGVTLTDAAYMAGFFDGEGCIIINAQNHGSRSSLLVRITNTDRGVLEEVQRAFGGRIYTQLAKANRKEIHRWDIATRQAGRFLLVLLPYLRLKAKQAQLAVAYQQKKYYNGGHLTEEERREQAATRAMIKELNKHGR